MSIVREPTKFQSAYSQIKNSNGGPVPLRRQRLNRFRLSGFESQLSSFTNHYLESVTRLLTEYSTIRNWS